MKFRILVVAIACAIASIAPTVAVAHADSAPHGAATKGACATKAEFKKITKGDTVADVFKTVGGKPKRSSSWGKGMKTYNWWACDHENWINVDAKHGKVVAKYWNTCGTPRLQAAVFRC